ncbi:neuroblast differentiation-associated protein AHNAK-like [Thunnus thynnus]|uniref:neuroblast differentiation-associated protein AHNAK-like n=1 Tax=Thunnus thynnus TaxID=8237 RepID=UPI00352753FD
MSKLKQEVPSPESGVIVKTAKDGCAEGLIYGGGGKEGIFIKEVVPESPASKSLKLKQGDQILSATVYFDNVSYEDAIQIMEHAQAYKVKLCLKRNPDITETEPAVESDFLRLKLTFHISVAQQEEELYSPEMREQAKTKKRNDTRISWPKFPSFGKGRKSRFTRSHSSSEADEQRKLELSPTTSYTESPIKSQDALKGKKKHKLKLSGLTKKSRVSSSEEQDTDAPTPGQVSGADIHQTHSPDRLESPPGETPNAYATDVLTVVEDSDLRLEQNQQKLTEPQTVQHKAELITVDSTLKTTDLTVALADQESGIKSPDGKKKKKEKSELKMKLLGKDKHKKDAKVKSPKRLKTLGASIEKTDPPKTEKSDVIPVIESQTELQGDQLALDTNTQIISSESPAKSMTTPMKISVPEVELDISDIALIKKSQQKGEEKTKKGKGIKQKQETKTGPTFKLPKIGLSDIATEETIQQISVNVEECTTKIEQFTTEGKDVKEDPYYKLSKSSLSRAELPKREDIEIPGMEDVSKRTTAKGIKVPKAVSMGPHEEIQPETVQLSIDVDSVKEAVSKLPGFKLPKVDPTGVPIPEEITVIDANAQRISVKTPTKAVDTKTKHEAHFTKFDVTASPEIPKTPVKLPKIKPADLTSEELLSETKVDFKGAIHQTQEIEKTEGTEGIKAEYQLTADLSSKESDKKSKKAKIVMPSFGIAKPDIRIPNIGIDLPKQTISEQKYDKVKGERTTFLQEGKIVGVMSDIKIPEIETSAMTVGGELKAPSDNTEYIDSVGGSSAKKDGGIKLTSFGVKLDAAQAKADVSFPEIKGEVKDFEAEEHTIKLPTFGTVIPDISVNVPDATKDIHIDGAEMKTLEREGKGSKFKMPSLGISKPKVKGPKMDLSLSKTDVDVRLPEAPEFDVTVGSVDVSIPEQKLEIKKPELEIKPLQSEGDLDGQGSKFKMPKLGIKMPKIKRPEFDLSLSKKDIDVTVPEAKCEVEFPEAPDVNVTLGNVDVSIPEQKLEVKKPELKIQTLKSEGELDGQGSKFKMPKFGIKMPKIKGPEFDLSLSKKNVDVPEATAEVKFPEAPDTEITLGSVDVSIPKQKLDVKKPELEIQPLKSEGDLDGQGSKFKMPKLGIKMPKIKGPDFDLSLSKKDVHVPEATAEVKFPEAPEIDVTQGNIDMSIPEQKMEVEKPQLEIKSLEIEGEPDVQGGKFKMPKLGIKMPKIKGPEFDLSLSKKDVHVPEATAEVKFPEAPKTDVTQGNIDVSIPEQKMEVEKSLLEIKPLKIESELDGQGSKFKMPKLGITMPKVKGPEIDLSISKKDVDVTLPEAKAEVNLPDVELKEPSAKVEIKGAGKATEGSPSKFKMPSFKLPKFGPATPNVSVEISDKNKDIQIPETQLKTPKDGGKVDITVPNIDIESPSLDVKTTAAELDGKGSKFKMPKFGISLPKVKGPEIDLSLSKRDVDVTLPEAESEVKLPDVEHTEHGFKVKVKASEIEVHQQDVEGSPSKLKIPTIPNISAEVPDIDKDVKIDGADINIPEEGPAVHIATPSIDIEGPSIDMKSTGTEQEGKGSKFKMPKLGMAMPNIKGPEIHFGLSKKDADVTLPEAKAEVKFADVEVKEHSAKVDIKSPEKKISAKSTDGSPSKFKMPTFKLPKFGVGTPSVSAEVPDIDKDAKIDGADINIPGEGSHIATPSIDIESPSIDMKTTVTEQDGKESKFKMPHLGFSMPKVKGPKIDLSLSKKDVEVTLPEAKADIKIPEAPKIDVNLGKVDVSIPEAKMEVTKPELEMQDLQTEGELDGQGEKLKMRKIKAPEFDLSLSKTDVNVTLPEMKAEDKLPDAPKIDVSLGKAKVLIPEAKVEVEKPELKIKPLHTEVEVEGQGSKFKMPKIGMSMPKVKAPEIDLSLSKKDKDVTLPDVKAGVELPEAPKIAVDMKLPECEADVDRHGSKFKMPKLGITMPKVKGPEIDLSFSKKDVDVSLPETKAEVQLPDVEAKEPSAKVEIKAPAIDVQTSNVEAPSSKFKLPSFKFPKFGAATPNVEVPDTAKEIKIDGADMDVSVPQKDIDVPEVKAGINLPEVDVKGSVMMEQQPSVEVDAKLKKPRFSLSGFSFSKPSVKAVEVDVSAQGVNAAIPEGKVELKGGEVDMKPPECEAEIDKQGSKFKMPKFGISMPKVTGPESDLSLSKKDVDVTLPEAKVEVKRPEVEVKEPSAEVEIKAPEIKVATKHTEESPSKFKMPTFKLPKFGAATPKVSVEVPDVNKDIKIDGAKLEVPKEGATVDVTAPSIDTEGLSVDVKAKGSELEGSGSKFKMPKFDISMPKVKMPEIDLSLSKKDIDVPLPEAKAEFKLPDVEVNEPEAAVSVPDAPDVKIDGAGIKIPEDVLAVNIAAPSIDTDGPSIDVKLTGTEHEGKGSKFKLPSLGFSMPQVKGPDTDFSLSKKDIDVTLPEAKAEVQLPDFEVKEPSAKVEIEAPGIDIQTSNTEGSPSKFKMPTLKLPTLGAATPQVSVEVPDVDKDIKVDGADLTLPEAKAEVKIPDAKLKKSRFSLPKFSFSKQSTKQPEVNVSLPEVDVSLPEGNVEVKQPEMELKPPKGDAEVDGQESKFKMPKFGISMPKVKGPEINLSLSKKDGDVTLPEAEVQLPDVEMKQLSAKMEIKAPETEAQSGNVEGLPSELKMPTFTLPEFGAATPKVSVEVPDVNKGIKIDGAKLEVPKEGATLNVIAPSIDTESLYVDVKAKGSDLEGSGSKFKMPKFDISMPKVKMPEIDLSLSKKDIDVPLPEAKAEVKLPDVEVHEPEAAVSVPNAPDVAGTPSATVVVPDMDKDIKIDGAGIKIPEDILAVNIAAPSIDADGPSIDVKLTGTEHEGKGSKFKLPSLGFSMPQVKGPDIDLSLSKKDVDVTLPEAKAEVQLPDVEVKEPSAKVEIEAPGIDIQTSNTEGSPSKFKMPTLKLPTLGAATPQVSVEVPDVDRDIKVDGADLTLPEAKAEVKIPDAKLKKSRFSLPKFSFSKQSTKQPEVDVSLPEDDVSLAEGNVEVKQPEVELKPPEGDAELDGQESKFKMPRFGISMPKVKGPEINLSLSKKDVDITLPEAAVQLPDVKMTQQPAKIEIEAPETEVKTGNVEGLSSELKMPTFKLPKFEAATPKVSVEVPDVNKDIKIDGAKLEVPKEGAMVDVTAPSIDTEGLSVDVKAKGSELEGSGSKFKMPKFDISMPKVKMPEIDLSLSKKDIDVPLPEAKAEFKLPDVEVNEPEAAVSVPDAPDVAGTPSATIEVPDMDKDIKIDGAGIKIPGDILAVNIAAPSIDTDGPSIDVKLTGTEHEGKGSKFKLPSLGFSMPQVKGPDIDLSLSKKDVDVTLPEAKSEVQLPDVEVKEPSAKVEIEAPGIDIQTGNTEGSKFKMPTLKLPKFGGATSQVSVEVPDVDKDIKVDGADLTLPEAKAEVKIPDVEIKEPTGSISVSQEPITESDAKLRKPSWTLPRFSFSKTSVKPLEAEVNLDVPKVDVTLPETKTDVHLPDIDIKQSSDISIEGAPAMDPDAKLKKSRFSLFSFSKQSTKQPEVDVSLPEVDVSLPEENVEAKQPEVELKPPKGDAEVDVQESKFKMPKFGISMPKVKGPEINLSLSKKDGDVTLPESAPETEAQTGDVEGSPSKLKMPTFTLPKFGAATPKVSVETPDVNKDIKIDEAKPEVPKEGSGSMFKMPKFGISVPKGKGPETDLSLSKKDVDVTLPGAKVQLPDVKKKQPSAKTEIKAPETEAQTGNVEGSPSKLKMPTFTLPKFGAATPKVSVEAPDVNKDIKIDEAKSEVPKEGSGSMFKMPKFGISMPKGKGPETDLSLSKKDVDVTLPGAKVQLPDVKKKQPSAKTEIKAPETEAQTGNVEGSPSKLKMPTFTLPKFGAATPKVSVETPDVNKDIKIDEAKPEVPKEGSGSMFKMPKFGISMPKVKEPETDLSSSKKDVDVTLPGAKVQLPDVKKKQPSAKTEIKAPETEAQTGNVEGSPSKLKMPTFTLPKFGAATPKVSVETPDVNKDIKIDEAKLEVPKEGSGSMFKMPKFGISMTKVKEPEVDLSLSKKEVDVPVPEAKAKVKLPDVEVKQSEEPDASVEDEATSKRPNWAFPRFSFSRTGGKAPDVDVNLETPKVDVTSPELKAEVCVPDVEIKGPSMAISMEEPPAEEVDANLKKPRFSLPRFSFSKSSVKEPEVSADLPHVDVSLPEGDVKVKQPEMEIKDPELEAEHDGQGSKFKLPKFGIALPKAKGPEVDSNAPQKDVDVTLPEVKAEVKLPEAEVKELSANVEIKTSEIEAKSKDVGGSPMKFKMPTLKMPKFGGASQDVTTEAPDVDKVTETDGAKIKEDVTVNIKGPSVDIKTDVSKVAVSDSETPKAETDSVGLGSPSKFKLSLFKMPKLNFSRPKTEDEHVSIDTECKDNQLEMEVEPKEESKSPKMTLTSFGEILKNIDVEFDVPKTDKEEENLDTSKEVHETAELKKQEAKGTETNTKQDTTKSSERTGWFKFPKFGLSSPSEPAKVSEKDEHKDEKSPVGETVDEEISPTCSVQSSDAFADISSTMTSEHVGLSLSSPTKVTVKYSDPNFKTGLGEMHSNIITSTTRTELISVEPNLPEKITILSSGLSSSSEDTLRLESGKIHVITSNIQATPETQQAKILTAVQVQSAGGLPLQSEAKEAASWTVENTQSGRRTVFEKLLVRETSSESKETIVKTKQTTHIFDSAEPISDETATSIQRLKDSVHSEKMRFFDGAKK